MQCLVSLGIIFVSSDLPALSLLQDQTTVFIEIVGGNACVAIFVCNCPLDLAFFFISQNDGVLRSFTFRTCFGLDHGNGTFLVIQGQFHGRFIPAFLAIFLVAFYGSTVIRPLNIDDILPFSSFAVPFPDVGIVDLGHEFLCGICTGCTLIFLICGFTAGTQQTEAHQHSKHKSHNSFHMDSSYFYSLCMPTIYCNLRNLSTIWLYLSP